jgi:hypothetical protein
MGKQILFILLLFRFIFIIFLKSNYLLRKNYPHVCILKTCCKHFLRKRKKKLGNNINFFLTNQSD